jgi:hypothetical protein
MKNHIFLLMMILFITGSCQYPKYLAKFNQLEKSPYGSYIIIDLTTYESLYGELIAVDSSSLYILQDKTMKNDDTTAIDTSLNFYKKDYTKIAKKDVVSYDVYFAKPQMLWWTIPLMTASTMSHGYFLLYTAPVNFVGTIIMSARGNTNYRYTNKKLPMEELFKFARYPQGLPY